jgi:hypothetical protein
MTFKIKDNTLVWPFLCIGCILYIASISSCGKASSASAAGLNIEYEVLNLSPDLGSITLYVNYNPVNTSPFYFGVNQGYFYVPSLPSASTPYQFRSALSASSIPLFSIDSLLAPNTKYSLFIVGSESLNTLKQIFTVDTTTVPALGRGKVRFVDASPSGAGGFDLTANGAPVFSQIIYPNYSGWMALPVGNYDFQINATGNPAVLKDMPAITIQDGRLYTIYAYGYTNRIDSAAFNAGIITNR